VAKLAAGDNVLRPRVRIIADEHLTGPSQELVQTRLDLWMRTHVERSLGPLFVLSVAEDITGIARGIAFQIVEALGVLDRSHVAQDVKSLEQSARAALRNHGVRFGAYHLYIPALLKPGPRALAAQLWALKFGGPEMKGLDELQRLAASGRTSMPVDKETPKTLYRTVGYRVCGERAVRVDILERLADLIRPAIAWRAGSAGSKPAGAFGGGGFTVTQPMTSLTGASGEDFASILRSLGYRMERRPKPPELEAAPVTAVTAETAAAETAVAEISPAPAEDQAAALAADAPAAEMVVPVAEELAAPNIIPAPEAKQPRSEPDRFTEQHQADADRSAESPPQDTAPTSGEAQSETLSAEAAPAGDAVPAPAPASEEPALIEVWRPGGRSAEERRPRHKPRPARHARTPAQPSGESAPGAVAAESAVAEGAPAAAAAPAAANEGRRQRYRRNREFAPADNGAQARADAPEQTEGGERKRFQRPERKERPDRDERRPRGDRKERGGGDRPRGERSRGHSGPAQKWSSAVERRNEPDPNSPFAKLAALKAQLEAGDKGG
jgi:ATP-dependent RNA helicase SUPV3L1/SUV3